ncbi:hypothetical protein [Enterobacter hormaechei]|uniref:hypothetical protein n=1 Tax=Enterobacter hormaechei TaxID=158836 RepID=UPI0015E558B8|nr:hypothetical protein [Enterobacter hormaechei]QLP51297.1 hypothetical protein HV094_05695 [Enterobacter hormaechei]QLP61292.1 hypothetical protein HV088_05695 [Enterobacter hormaechei]
MKQKFIEWFTKNNNGCSPAMEDDRSFVYEMTQHMFEAYQAGVAEGEAKCAALAAESHGFKRFFIFAINAAFDGCDITGDQIQEVAKEIGLVRVESYSAEKHAEMSGDPSVMEEGDDFYIMNKTPATDDFLAEVRAQGVEMFADSLLCPDLDDTIREFADELRKGVQS